MFQRGTEDKLPRVEDERLLPFHLYKRGELLLRELGIDVRVLGVVEDSKEPIQSHINAGGLDHRGIEWIQNQTLGIDGGSEVSI